MNNKIKIIHLISALSRGGRERQLATIINNTDHSKYPSKVVYFKSADADYIEEYQLKDKIIRIKSDYHISRIFELNKLLTKEKPEILFSWGNLESIIILLLKPFHRFKFVNGSVRHGIRTKTFSQYLRFIVLHLSKNIVSNSYAGLKANKLKRGTVLYNGLENKFLNTANFDRVQKRKELVGSKSELPIFVSAANLVPYKDYFSVLEALKKIKDENLDFFYLILGDGPLRKEIEKTILNYKLESNVKILGNLKIVEEYLKVADLFIHSSKGEGCSNAILEAMAAGLPIIASDTGGTNEIVTKANGYLFEYRDANAIYELIKKYYTFPDKFIMMGKRSTDIVREKYTIEKMMNNYYHILESL